MEADRRGFKGVWLCAAKLVTTSRVATVSIATQARTNFEKNSKFHLTGIPLPFRIFRAKCTAHISTRKITTIQIGPFFSAT